MMTRLEDSLTQDCITQQMVQVMGQSQMVMVAEIDHNFPKYVINGESRLTEEWQKHGSKVSNF